MNKPGELSQAMEALKLGNLTGASQILSDLVSQEPNNADAWWMLFSVLEDPIEKFDCLKQVVRIRPDDKRARQDLKKYKAGIEYREANASRRLVRWKREEKEAMRRGILDGFKSFISSILQLFKILLKIPYDLMVSKSWWRW
jgi:hypothetical protein